MNPVFKTTGCKRYRFPTHTNELVYDRSVAKTSEVFMVVLEAGEAPPLHVHDDTEQVFHLLEGHGILTLGAAGPNQRTFRVQPGDVVLIPPSTPHAIRADQDGAPLRYLCVDCFGATGKPKEDTWDEHVKANCRLYGWSYDQVVGKKG